MNISSVSASAASQRLSNAARGAANVNANAPDLRPQRTGQAEAASRARPPAAPARDTYEPGNGPAARVAVARQPDPVRDTARAAERNVYDANRQPVRPRDEAARATVDLVG